METISVIALLIIGIGIGFVLTKGFSLEKEIKEDSKKAKEEKEKQLKKD